jgi:hypothetical protein
MNDGDRLHLVLRIKQAGKWQPAFYTGKPADLCGAVRYPSGQFALTTVS